MIYAVDIFPDFAGSNVFFIGHAKNYTLSEAGWLDEAI
jgi:hypothetical protein